MKKLWEWKILYNKSKLGTTTLLGILQNKNRSEGRGNMSFSNHMQMYKKNIKNIAGSVAASRYRRLSRFADFSIFRRFRPA